MTIGESMNILKKKQNNVNSPVVNKTIALRQEYSAVSTKNITFLDKHWRNKNDGNILPKYLQE